jgi:hypothetical protein
MEVDVRWSLVNIDETNNIDNLWWDKINPSAFSKPIKSKSTASPRSNN